jgi:hypothetical protein
VAFAGPAYWLTTTSFRPIDERIQLDERQAAQSFNLDERAALYLEYGLTTRAPGAERPTVSLTLNGVTVATLRSEQLYAPERDKILLPLAPARRGSNELRLVVTGAPSDSVSLNGRLHNYYGISSGFPRVYVVADDTASYALTARPAIVRIVQFAGFVAAGLAVLSLILLVSRRRREGRMSGLRLFFPSIVPWAALAYGAATPQAIWLSPGALLVSVVAGWALGSGVWWLAAHRVRAATVAGVTAVTIVVLEIALRLFNVVHPTFIFYSDEYSRYRGRPGSPYYDARFNSRGFNDVEHDLSKPATVARRIVAIGDSVAVGVVPYRDNFLTLLESSLAGDGPVEVVKMGVAATEPIDYLAILVKEGLAFHPDLVLTCLFVGNDFEVRGRKPYEYSYVTTMGHALWTLWGARGSGVLGQETRRTEYRDDEPTLPADQFLEIEVDRSWIYVRNSDRLPPAISTVAGQFLEMRDRATRAGADFVLVIVPDEVQVNDALGAEVVRASGRRPDEFDFDLPNAQIAGVLTGQGVAVLDLLSAFREAGRRERLYKPQDTHWNLAGNRLAAATIAPFLRDRLRR